MNPFVRFIVSILVAGGAVNLLIVCMANAHSRSVQQQHMLDQKQQFAKIVGTINGHFRRADFVVESQQIDAHGAALQTTILVRQYASINSDESQPLPIERVVIPGNEVAVDGVILEASDDFASDAPDFQILRGARLAYFGMIRGKDEVSTEADPLFTYFPRYKVPQLTRLDPGAKVPGSYEVALWNYLWSIFPETTPTSPAYTSRGLHITWLAPYVMAVRRESTYTAFIDPSGKVEIHENFQATIPGLLDEMLSEGQHLNDQREQQ